MAFPVVSFVPSFGADLSRLRRRAARASSCRAAPRSLARGRSDRIADSPGVQLSLSSSLVLDRSPPPACPFALRPSWLLEGAWRFFAVPAAAAAAARGDRAAVRAAPVRARRARPARLLHVHAHARADEPRDVGGRDGTSPLRSNVHRPWRGRLRISSPRSQRLARATDRPPRSRHRYFRLHRTCPARRSAAPNPSAPPPCQVIGAAAPSNAVANAAGSLVTLFSLLFAGYLLDADALGGTSYRAHHALLEGWGTTPWRALAQLSPLRYAYEVRTRVVVSW